MAKSRPQIIKEELDADPLGRGYSGMTDQQVVDDMNTANRPGKPVALMTPAHVFNVFDPGEFAGITSTAHLIKIQIMLSVDQIEMSAGTPGARLITEIFGNPSTTRSTIRAVVDGSGANMVARWQELEGLTRGHIRLGEVTAARTA
jgi:hypothetical protein|tara:strand:+ start:23842 stop:24279 length:438 start_codon:yes stop_codon:yes gene_type:complete